MYAIKSEIEELVREKCPWQVYNFLRFLKCSPNPLIKFSQLCYGSINTIVVVPCLKEIHANLYWVLGNTGIAGNENTNTSAKSATTNVDKLVPTRAIPHTDMMKVIKIDKNICHCQSTREPS